MANKTLKQLSSIIFSALLLVFFALSSPVLSQAYGEGGYGDCEYGEGCDTSVSTDSDGTTTDSTDSSSGSTTTDEDKDKPKKTVKDDDSDTSEEPDGSAGFGEGEETDGSQNAGLSIPKLAGFSFLTIIGVSALWKLLLAAARRRGSGGN